jgi:hypothetical protein
VIRLPSLCAGDHPTVAHGLLERSLDSHVCRILLAGHQVTPCEVLEIGRVDSGSSERLLERLKTFLVPPAVGSEGLGRLGGSQHRSARVKTQRLEQGRTGSKDFPSLLAGHHPLDRRVIPGESLDSRQADRFDPSLTGDPVVHSSRIVRRLGVAPSHLNQHRFDTFGKHGVTLPQLLGVGQGSEALLPR